MADPGVAARGRRRSVMRQRVVDVIDDGWRVPDELWARIEPRLPLPPPQPKGGRPWAPARPIRDGSCCLLRTGCRWQALPRCFGAPSTVHDRFPLWVDADVFRQLWLIGRLEDDEL